MLFFKFICNLWCQMLFLVFNEIMLLMIVDYGGKIVVVFKVVEGVVQKVEMILFNGDGLVYFDICFEFFYFNFNVYLGVDYVLV